MASLYELERAFAANIQPTRSRYGDICWIWTGIMQPTPYGPRPILRIGKEQLSAAHVSYTIFRDPLAPGLHIRHVCPTVGCVHPLHLERRAKSAILRLRIPGPPRPAKPYIPPHTRIARTKEAGTKVRKTLDDWEID